MAPASGAGEQPGDDPGVPLPIDTPEPRPETDREVRP